MALVVVDIADMKISNNPSDTLVTYSLGSCIGVAIYDPVLQLGGMIHCMLPLSKVDKEKAKTRPYMFVDTGMNLLLGGLYERGLRKARA
ncbi:MAG: chemotaxis protein CheD, partial [Thermodesulfobacteriota bacterium]